MAARPLLLGHRGARKYAVENTSDAFLCALEDGCDGFEFDVRITADRVAVVCHDARFCGASVAKSGYQTLYDAGSKRNQEISPLEEILGFGQRAFLNIELKVGGAEELLIKSLQKYPAGKGLIVSSFLPAVITTLYELGANFPLGIICENQRQLAKWRELPVHAVMAHRRLVNQGLIDDIRNTTLESKEGPSTPRQVFVWTVNSAPEMRKFAEMGVDGIISDDTKLLVETFGRP